MNYSVGDTLVHPRHGATSITMVGHRNHRGTRVRVLTLQSHTTDLTIQIPESSLDLVGIRPVMTRSMLSEVRDILRAEPTDELTNWSRRFKANEEKIASGDVRRVAEVVRDLSKRHGEKGLSAGEKRMLDRARTNLLSEIALTDGVDDLNAAGELLDQSLNTHST